MDYIFKTTEKNKHYPFIHMSQKLDNFLSALSELGLPVSSVNQDNVASVFCDFVRVVSSVSRRLNLYFLTSSTKILHQITINTMKINCNYRRLICAYKFDDLNIGVGLFIQVLDTVFKHQFCCDVPRKSQNPSSEERKRD